MPNVTEGSFTYTFPTGWVAEKYDQTSFYLNHFQAFAGGSKAVDVLAFGPLNTLWLIEQKDYRAGSNITSAELFQAMADKVIGTLACLVAARSRAQPNGQCQSLASLALGKHKVRCVLHVEQPPSHSKLFPQVIDPKSARQKLRQVLRPVDEHAEIGDKALLNSRSFGWNIA